MDRKTMAILAGLGSALILPSAGSVAAADQWDSVGKALGKSGTLQGSVYKVSLPRSDLKVAVGGEAVKPALVLGFADGGIAINLQSAGKGKAASTGDFVLTADEVNPVIKELTDHGIEVTAVHSHMLEEQPRLFFLHFWGVNDTIALSDGLRAALDKVATKKE
jgi:hypothetical protein